MAVSWFETRGYGHEYTGVSYVRLIQTISTRYYEVGSIVHQTSTVLCDKRSVPWRRLVVDSAGDPGLASWHTTFHFETDQKRLNSIREVKARLKPLEDKSDQFSLAQHVSVYK